MSKALLVKLAISQWYNKITDSNLAGEITSKYYGIEKSEDTYVKKLVPNVALRDVNKAITALRTTHYRLTLPWQDDSVRILSAKLYAQYQQEISERISDMNKAVDQFLKDYPVWVEQAREQKKGLFQERDYPAPETIRQLFEARVTFLPFPNSEDFRLELNSHELEELKESTKNAVAEALSTAEKNMIDQITKHVVKLHASIEDPENIVRESSLTKLVDTVDIISAMEMGSPRVEYLCNAVKAITSKTTIERLRNNPGHRAEITEDLRKLRDVLENE